MHRLALLIVACLLTSCATVPPAQMEARIRKYLPGTWAFDDSRFGTTIHFQKTYFPDGTARGTIDRTHTLNNGVVVHAPTTRFTSRWRVKGNVLESYDARSQPPDALDPTEVFVDRIIRIDENINEYSDLTNGGRVRNHRVHPMTIAR